jgi:MFS family permease
VVRARLPSIPLTGERKHIFGWMCLLIAVNQAGFGAIVPVVALYAESFGVSTTAIGLTIAVYGLARFLVNVPAGRLADARGRRWTLAIGGALTVLGNLLCAAAPDYTIFLVARFIAGAGAAMVLTGGQIVLADIAPKAVRGRVMATYQGVFLFAVGAGGFPGGLLAEQFGLRTPFAAYAAAAAGVTLLALRRVPETRSLRSEAPAEAGGRASSGTSTLAQLAVVWRTPGFLPVSFVSFAAFFARTGGMFSIVPLIAEDEIGLGPDQIGLGLGLVSLAALFLTIPAGIMVDRFGRKPTIVPSTLLSVVAMLSFASAPGFGWYLLACLCWGISSGVSGAAPSAYAADIARPGMMAATLGAYRTIADSGYVIGPLVLGLVADVTSARAALLVCAALSLAAGLTFFRFAPETLEQVERPQTGPTPATSGATRTPDPALEPAGETPVP